MAIFLKDIREKKRGRERKKKKGREGRRKGEGRGGEGKDHKELNKSSMYIYTDSVWIIYVWTVNMRKLLCNILHLKVTSSSYRD